MKKILAVSGGVDSVVMLHLYHHDPDVLVAHFDHGIRPNSADDCAFVERLAHSYQLPFFSKRAHLGANSSEESARSARYGFLNQLAKEQNGQIYTAHHQDDLIESVVINILRGTGWRGLAPLNNPAIVRPLLGWTKLDIYKYAAQHHLVFREDQTNSDDNYLRNRIRFKLLHVDSAQKIQLAELAQRQRIIASEVDNIFAGFNFSANYPRELFAAKDIVTFELLRYILHENGVSLTRPQLMRALDAIQSFAAGKKFSLDKTHFLKISKYYFSVTSS